MKSSQTDHRKFRFHRQGLFDAADGFNLHGRDFFLVNSDCKVKIQ